MRRCFRELSIADATMGRAMDDLVVHRLDVVDWNAPLRCGCLLQHLTRSRAAAAHQREEVTHAPRAIGVLIAEASFVGRRLLHPDAPPTRFDRTSEHPRPARP